MRGSFPLRGSCCAVLLMPFAYWLTHVGMHASQVVHVCKAFGAKRLGGGHDLADYTHSCNIAVLGTCFHGAHG